MKKFLLALFGLGYAGWALAQSDINFLTAPYSGFGRMPLTNALTITLPPDITWASNLADNQQEVSWRVVNGTIGDALTQMSEGKFVFTSPTQKKILISSVSNNTKTTSVEALSALVSPSFAAPEKVADIQKSKELVKVLDSSPTIPLVIAPAVTSPPINSGFMIRAEDETLSLAIRRWAGSTGYQLVWEAGKDFPARETSYNSPDIISAIESVMNDTAHSNFPLHACVYENKVIRILQVSQGCRKINAENQS